MSDSVFLPFLFGDRLEIVLRRMLSGSHNLFGYEHVRIVEANGRVAGMLLGYSYEQMRGEMLATGLFWLRLLGLELLRRLPQLLKIAFSQPGSNERGARWLSPGEFYVSNMAVRPEYRRQGLGRSLLADAITRAHQYRCLRIALDVDAGNEAAIRLYDSMGFVREEHNLMVMGKFEFRRMSRSVGPVREPATCR